MNNYNQYLSDIQIGFRNLILNYDINWNIFLTLTYSFNPKFSRVQREVNLIQRFFGKKLKSQILYFGIFARTHVHILLYSKKPLFVDDRLITINYENFYLKSVFPFKYNFDLSFIENEYDIESISQYLVRKKHMNDGSYSIICSNPKKLRRCIKIGEREKERKIKN